MNEGILNFRLENISFEETERIREIVHTLISYGALHVRNGSVILHFDNDANLQEIEIHQKRWKRGKISSTATGIKIELIK